MITMPHPQLPLSQLPSQNPQREVTSDHANRVVSTHSSTRPFALVCPQSRLLCCVHDSAVRCRIRIPRPHHSRRRFFFFVSTVLTLAFILALPFTESTIVSQSPLISRVCSFQATSIPSSRGGFMDSSKLRVTFSLGGLSCVISLIQSFSLPAPLCHRCVPLYSSVMEPNLVLPPFERCRGPTPHSKRTGFSTTQLFFTPKWSEEPSQW